MSLLAKFKERQLKARVLSSFVMLPLIFYPLYKGGIFFSLLVVLVAMLMLHEWFNIISLYPLERKTFMKWYVSGIIYVLALALSIIYLRNIDGGYYHTFWLIICVFSGDIFGYFIGTTIGGPKLAPKISTNKTISGAVGAILGAFIVSILFFYWCKFYAKAWRFVQYPALAPFISVMAQLGDLLESQFKRYFNVKDSGKIIPGHGGVLDRCDGLVIASFCLAIFFIITGR